MRGLRLLILKKLIALGITPAHAGLTPRLVALATKYRDHPRACGAYAPASMLWAGLLGSPPRMRGLQYSEDDGALRTGITPAHAGLTFGSASGLSFSRDHPRACGAYHLRLKERQSAMGSPPRMRGLPSTEPSFSGVQGITPAHAGLTRHRI